MRFSEVTGHSELKQRLIQSVKEERVPHAQIFHGPEGSGSLALALAYASYLSCLDRQSEDSCGKCSSCLKYDKLVHPDLHFSFPVFTTSSVTSKPVSDDFIAEWRTALLESPYISLQHWYSFMGVENKQGIINKPESEAILRKLNLKAFESTHKVMIIWMPEKMNAPASNTLLKMIEEPPPMTVFLLVAESTEQIIPTVLSRTQLIRVPRLRDEDLLETLRKAYPGNDEKLKKAVHLSEGNYCKAIENLDLSEESEYQLELFTRIMRLTFSRKFKEIFDWVEEISGLGRERQKAFLTFAIRLVRENYLLNMEQHELVRLSPEESEFSGRFSAFIHDLNTPAIIKELDDACLHIEVNAYARIVFLDFALKLVKLIK
ncbi:ATP-binding protein [Bacteroidota bacterium]